MKTLHEEVAGKVSVASIYSIGLSHMNSFVQSFLREHPKANVRLQYQHPHRVYELVESDQVDFGLVSYPRSSRTIKATAWREEPMVVVCSPRHKRPSGGKFRSASCMAATWSVSTRISRFARRSIGLWPIAARKSA